MAVSNDWSNAWGQWSHGNGCWWWWCVSCDVVMVTIVAMAVVVVDVILVVVFVGGGGGVVVVIVVFVVYSCYCCRMSLLCCCVVVGSSFESSSSKEKVFKLMDVEPNLKLGCIHTCWTCFPVHIFCFVTVVIILNGYINRKDKSGHIEWKSIVTQCNSIKFTVVVV